MLEIEIKARLPFTLSQETIHELGFTTGDALHEIDLYFNGTDRDFLKTDEALRLRYAKNKTTGAEECFVTYKGPKLDDRSQTRKEIQTEIFDLEKMRELFEALGYQAVFTVEKQRRQYHLKEITLCIDEVKDLGTYLELEQVTADEGAEKKEAVIGRLLSVLDSLCVSRENLTAKSYLELLIERVTS